MSHSFTITFARGARRVTGSNFLVEADDNGKKTRLLIDCGLAQGERFCESVNQEKFSYDPASVDAIFFTHAHADHIGLFPKLVRDGFKGKAYTTAATKELMSIMLEDSLHILSDEAKRCGEAPAYEKEDVRRATEMVEALPYHQKIEIAPGISVTLYNAGHIIGSASAAIDAFGKRLVFTGDLGRVPAILVPDREVPEKIDYLFMESVYGDRVHESFEMSKKILLSAVSKAHAKKGVLLIPAFSLERTQIILSVLDEAFSKDPSLAMPVFMDSPLAAKVTEIYNEHPEFLREEIRARVEKGDDPFSFPLLKITPDMESSREIEKTPLPKVIIAGAGMSHGGRIRAHEAKYLPDPNTTILFSGYQAAGSLGRRIKDGQKKVDIDGREVAVRAEVLSLDGFSAHADRDDLLNYAEAAHPEKIFVILGETTSATFLAQRINGFLDIPVDVPREGETVTLPGA